MNIYISNISFHTTEEMLVQMFSAHGKVRNARIVKDDIQRAGPRIGFVEMQSFEAGQEAIRHLNGKEIQGRSLRVSQAREQNGNKRN